MKREEGITLIELLVVMFLLVLLSSIMLPNMSGIIEGYRLDTAARQMAQEIREVQQWSITLQDSYVIKFYSDFNYYHLPLRQDNFIKHRIDLPQGVTFEEVSYVGTSSSRLSFNAKGTPNLGGHIILKGAGQYREISITPVTGRVKVYKGRRVLQ
ncbi:prepilin-type N-terminal cleavage/methylation domain-containing protein [Metallumcola ferriviriculae]|uniref:Prepilin-type N-terminal cleavage/methylation domain-containing protein n=1 Tax=Metallumcola ferriviriculae TaxID=3039180 RepID=A0AAU0USA2_9FIRM|nr:prepilin-type N-terminal cleavage/methylation domain-containing protein [Desulfitibacteraceae bacterium MK1]